MDMSSSSATTSATSPPPFHTDSQLQAMVYKLAPHHYWQELRRRIEFMNRTKLTDEELKTVASKRLAQLAAKLCSADENVSLELEYTPTSELILTNMKKEDDGDEPENEPAPSTSKENAKTDEVIFEPFKFLDSVRTKL